MRPFTQSRARPAAPGRAFSQAPGWQTDLRNNSVVAHVSNSSADLNADLTDPSVDSSSECWLIEENYYAEVLAVSITHKTDHPLLWSGLLLPHARVAALGENLDHCLNCHLTRSNQCKFLFLNGSGYLHRDLGQLGDNGARYHRSNEPLV